MSEKFYLKIISRHACSSKKLGSFFNIKDQIKLEHNNDLTYLAKSHAQKNTLEKQQEGLTKEY